MKTLCLRLRESLILIKQISGGHIGVAVVKGAGRLFDLASDLLNTGVNLGVRRLRVGAATSSTLPTDRNDLDQSSVGMFD
jgi:hypothetical protein